MILLLKGAGKCAARFQYKPMRPQRVKSYTVDVIGECRAATVFATAHFANILGHCRRLGFIVTSEPFHA
jgi:hypothetical protein